MQKAYLMLEANFRLQIKKLISYDCLGFHSNFIGTSNPRFFRGRGAHKTATIWNSVQSMTVEIRGSGDPKEDDNLILSTSYELGDRTVGSRMEWARPLDSAYNICPGILPERNNFPTEHADKVRGTFAEGVTETRDMFFSYLMKGIFSRMGSRGYNSVEALLEQVMSTYDRRYFDFKKCGNLYTVSNELTGVSFEPDGLDLRVTAIFGEDCTTSTTITNVQDFDDDISEILIEELRPAKAMFKTLDVGVSAVLTDGNIQDLADEELNRVVFAHTVVPGQHLTYLGEKPWSQEVVDRRFLHDTREVLIILKDDLEIVVPTYSRVLLENPGAIRESKIKNELGPYPVEARGSRAVKDLVVGDMVFVKLQGGNEACFRIKRIYPKGPNIRFSFEGGKAIVWPPELQVRILNNSFAPPVRTLTPIEGDQTHVFCNFQDLYVGDTVLRVLKSGDKDLRITDILTQGDEFILKFEDDSEKRAPLTCNTNVRILKPSLEGDIDQMFNDL